MSIYQARFWRNVDRLAEEEMDGLAPSQGIAIGLLLSIPLWAAVIGLVWWVVT